MGAIKYYIVGDNHNAIKTVVNQDEEIIVVPQNSFNEIVKYFDNLSLNKFDIIIINSEGIFDTNDEPTKHTGILLLKWLRIYLKLLNRIIITGFVSREDIIKNNPKDFILFAPSTYFLQLPFNLNEFNNLKLNSKAINSKDELISLYKPFIQPDFNIQQFGHSFANKFGLYALEKVHKLIDSKFSLTKFDVNNIFEFEKALLLYNFKLSNKPKIETIDSTSKPKKILFIDDQEDLGWTNLLKNILKPIDITSYKPDIKKNDYITKIINKTSNIKPDLVLLDLKLGGDSEKDIHIEAVSGYKTLVSLKNKFPALPIIMFSATNKAANLQKLLEAKAFGLWSKPRIESKLVLDQKYYDLIKIVKAALTKYKYEDEKIAIKANYLINNIENPKQKVIDYINSFDLIITDTNCWMMSLYGGYKTIDKIADLYKNLVITALFTNKNNFLIIDEIQRELLAHLYKMSHHLSNEKLEINALTANYGLNLMNKLIKARKIFVEDKHILKGYGSRFKFNYLLEKNFIKEGCYDTFEEEVIYTRDYYDVTKDKDNKKNNTLTEQTKILYKLNKKSKVHADDVFINIIHKKINEGKKNILFISEDLECIDNIIYFLKNKFTIDFENNVKLKKKYNIEKIRLGYFNGKNDNSNCFNITFMNPFDFSEELNRLNI